MNTPAFELDRSPEAFIATLEVDSAMMQHRNGDGFGLVSAVCVRIGDLPSSEKTSRRHRRCPLPIRETNGACLRLAHKLF
jgi:hypothetical protein